MHYHCEIIIPPDHDIEKSVSQIMSPFSENQEADNGEVSFWDFWVIGGRWAGYKNECGLDKEKLAAFRQWMTDENVKVSGLTCGKQELTSRDVARVDVKWQEMFPGHGEKCTLFRHSNDQYESSERLPGDVMRLGDLPKELTAARVIVAGPRYSGEGLEVHYMQQEDFWNGVNHVDAAWDSKVSSAIDKHCERIKNSKEEWRVQNTPTDDWLAITVDYHS